MNYLALFFVMLFMNGPSETAILTMTINNIQNLNGTLEIGIFNNGERFLEEGQAYKSISIKVTDTSETYVIKNLPEGTYAISLYHDKNSNGTCDRNFFGIPSEPYGFSNNFRPKFSAPSFRDCAFELEMKHNLSIDLIH